MHKHIATTFILFCVTALITGCGQPTTTKPLSPSEAHQKLIQILKEESNIEVVTKEFERTLWIYLPMAEGFLEMKAKDKPPAPPSDGPTTSPTVHFLEGTFEDSNFKIEYDISPSKKYAKDYGYSSSFSENYQTNQRNILTAISRAYSNSEEAPAFFVLVIADIVNGMEARTLLNLGDLKRAYTDQAFHGEYAKRVVSEQPRGDVEIVGDKEGKYINFRDITWPEFLVKQIIFRINYKYTQSAFPPSESDLPKDEILKAAAATIGAYAFTDFASVELHDLNDGALYTIAKEELSAYADEPSKGRLIHIKFR